MQGLNRKVAHAKFWFSNSQEFCDNFITIIFFFLFLTQNRKFAQCVLHAYESNSIDIFWLFICKSFIGGNGITLIIISRELIKGDITISDMTFKLDPD